MKCATSECGREATGKSKYCPTHKAEARAAWKMAVEADAVARDERNRKWTQVYSEAKRLGFEAGQAALPTPMVVMEGERVIGTVADGTCGFAGVVVRPATSSFARWLSKQGLAYPHYGGGLYLRIGEHGQSLERKEAHARAMRDHFRANNIECFATSRMD